MGKLHLSAPVLQQTEDEEPPSPCLGGEEERRGCEEEPTGVLDEPMHADDDEAQPTEEDDFVSTCSEDAYVGATM